MDKHVEGYEYHEGLDFELWASNTLPAFGLYHHIPSDRWEYYWTGEKDDPLTRWHELPDNPNIKTPAQRLTYARVLSRLEN